MFDAASPHDLDALIGSYTPDPVYDASHAGLGFGFEGVSAIRTRFLGPEEVEALLRGAPLADPDFFKQVYVDPESRTLAWPGELDLAPEPLYAEARRRRVPVSSASD